MKSLPFLAAASVLVLAGAAHGQTIANPSFESNLWAAGSNTLAPLTGWAFSAPGSNAEGWDDASPTGGAFDTPFGDQLIEFTTGTLNYLDGQISGLTAGNLYTICFWDQQTSGSITDVSVYDSWLAGAPGGISLAGPQIITVGGIGPGAWKRNDISFTAMGPDATVRLTGRGGLHIYLDNFIIGQGEGCPPLVPEPAGASLTLMAGLGMLLRRRRAVS
jgi:hypothetical protein